MTRNTKAILFICASTASATASEACVKLLSDHIATAHILLLRGLMICVVLMITFGWRDIRRELGGAIRPLVAVRSLAEGSASFFYFVALARMPMPPATALFLTAPLMMTLAGAVILRHKVGWRRWVSVLVGFAGVIVILRPSVAGLNPYAMLVLVAAAATVTRDLITTRLSAGISDRAILLVSMLGITAMGGVLSFGKPWPAISGGDLLILVAAAITTGIASYAAIRAFRLGEIAVIAPFRYTVIVWSCLFGYVLWGYVLDGPALAGVLMIAGSGLYTLHRERVRKQFDATIVATQA